MSNFIAAAVIFMVISPCVIVAQEPPSKTMSDEEMEEMVREIEEKGRQEQARFELFNECRPVWLSVTGINLNGEEEELTDSTERALQNAIEIRLRSARLYAKNRLEAGLAYLLVIAITSPLSDTGGNVSNVSIAYQKPVWDKFENSSIVETWEESAEGLISKGIGDILSDASQLADTFLVEYLRVNEEACDKK